ncbi:MAG: hypothetical protein AAFO03_15555 [Bacteroidota bacterium]
MVNTSVTFLGNQLLIVDLDTGYAINFLVGGPNDLNLLPKVETEFVAMLRLRI